MLTLQIQGILHLGVEDHLATSLTTGGNEGRKDSSPRLGTAPSPSSDKVLDPIFSLAKQIETNIGWVGL